MIAIAVECAAKENLVTYCQLGAATNLYFLLMGRWGVNDLIQNQA